MVPLLLVWLTGCLEPLPDLSVEDAIGGTYVGPVTFDVKAKLGPVTLVKDGCESEVRLFVDTSVSPASIEGFTGCTLESVGDVVLDLGGSVTDAPYMTGTVTTQDVEGTWDGYYVEGNGIYGSSSGKFPQDGTTIVFKGTFELERIDFGNSL